MARKISSIREKLLDHIRQHDRCSSKEAFEALAGAASYATVKRALAQLLEEGLIVSEGLRRATRYAISPGYGILDPVDLDRYFRMEIDERKGMSGFNHALIREMLRGLALFRAEELSRLSRLQDKFRDRLSGLPEAEYKKEFERLAIDLSWKSSQIEGNTYSLLETERLLKESQTAEGKTRDEATMLLNHKAALDFVLEHPDCAERLTVSAVEDIHAMLVKDLGVSRNIRSRAVGISGTNYRPLDNEYQIRDALQDMCAEINRRENVFEKTLLVLVLLSYIQPFTDGNKRTARIVANAVLMYHGHCPLSFRTADAMDYKKALLLFYEQNNLSAFKNIFMDQYEFAVNTYF